MNGEQILGEFVNFAIVLVFKLHPVSCVLYGKHYNLVTLKWEEREKYGVVSSSTP